MSYQIGDAKITETILESFTPSALIPGLNPDVWEEHPEWTTPGMFSKSKGIEQIYCAGLMAHDDRVDRARSEAGMGTPVRTPVAGVYADSVVVTYFSSHFPETSAGRITWQNGQFRWDFI